MMPARSGPVESHAAIQGSGGNFLTPLWAGLESRIITGPENTSRNLRLPARVLDPLLNATMKLKLPALISLLAVLLVAGCQSFKDTPTGYLTSVTITNQPMAAIEKATTTVFITHGFTGGSTGPDEFTFERPGTRWNDLAYGNAMFNETVTVRVVVKIRSLDAQRTFVGCNAWLVDAPNNPVFEDSHAVRKFREWPYEQLLDEIQKQLGE